MWRLRWIALVSGTSLMGWATGNAALKAVIYLLGPAAADGLSGRPQEITPLLVCAATTVAPFGESLVVWGVVALCQSKLRLGVVATSLSTSAVMALLHSAVWASIAVMPTFVLHAAIMFAARSRRQSGEGCLTIVAAHALQNTISIVRPLLMT